MSDKKYNVTYVVKDRQGDESDTVFDNTDDAIDYLTSRVDYIYSSRFEIVVSTWAAVT